MSKKAKIIDFHPKIAHTKTFKKMAKNFIFLVHSAFCNVHKF